MELSDILVYYTSVLLTRDVLISRQDSVGQPYSAKSVLCLDSARLLHVPRSAHLEKLFGYCLLNLPIG